MDWTKSMSQSFEFYIVNPSTWKDESKIDDVLSCKIDFDSSQDTLGSASFEVSANLGECYVRAYLVATQNEITEKIPLGTFLLQTPSIDYDGKSTSISIDGYTPLIELSEKMPSIGFSLVSGQSIMDKAFELATSNMRATATKGICSTTLSSSFVAETSDTWLTYLTDLLALASYHFDLDANGRVLFAPDQDTASLNPVWTYTDDNSSILYPDISLERDLFGIPNVVEVVWSDDETVLTSIVKNTAESSPVSIPNRGREIIYRETSPDLDNPTQIQLDSYAQQLLAEKSTLEYTLSYSHGYCPVRVGDCVELNYQGAGLSHVKAKVISQSINCESGCKVEETAVFTKYMGG